MYAIIIIVHMYVSKYLNLWQLLSMNWKHLFHICIRYLKLKSINMLTDWQTHSIRRVWSLVSINKCEILIIWQYTFNLCIATVMKCLQLVQDISMGIRVHIYISSLKLSTANLKWINKEMFYSNIEEYRVVINC